MSEQQEPKAFEPRKCRTGDHMFTPATATQWSCAECRSKAGKASSSRPRRLPIIAERPSATAADESIITPAALLELAGYNVRAIEVPNGVLLSVTSSTGEAQEACVGAHPIGLYHHWLCASPSRSISTAPRAR